MTPNRKSMKPLLQSALRKCTQIYNDGIHAVCTPAEYFALCEHFKSESAKWKHDYVMASLAKGDCTPNTHYMFVGKKAMTFPKDKFFMNCNIHESQSR